MNNILVLIIIMLLPFIAIKSANPKDIKKIAVEIYCEYQNDTEAKFIYLIKDTIKKSSIFRLTVADEPRIRIIIQMQDMRKIVSDNIYGVFYGVVWVSCNKTERGTSQIYISQMLGWGNPGTLQERAEDIIVKTDKIINDYLKH